MNLPTQNLRVVALQMTSTDDVSANFAQIVKLLGEIPDPHLADLVILPENCLFLRVQKNTEIQSFDLSEPEFKDLQKMSDQYGYEIWLGSIAHNNSLVTSNAMIRIKPGTSPQAIYQKIHLFDVDVEGAPPVRESDEFQHGSEPQVVTIKDWRIGLSICYDIRFAELFYNYSKLGIHALVAPSAFLVPTGKDHWEILLRARAIESQSYMIAPAQSGAHLGKNGGRRETWGHSLIIGPWGQILREAKQEGPCLLMAEFTAQELKKVRTQIPMHQHRRL